MGDAIDLVCREVLIEELIEPTAHGKFSNHPSETPKRSCTPSKCRRTCQEVDHGVAVVQVSSRRAEGLKRRRLMWDNEEGMLAEPVCEGLIKVGIKRACEIESRCMDLIHSVLPTEIRWKILGQLTVPELLSLRLVSRAYKESIDNFVKVNVTILGDSREFKGQCNLSMKSCRLVSLQNPSHRHLFKSPTPEEVKITRGICSLNFEELISRWYCLTKLEICWRSTMKNLIFGKKSSERCSARTILPTLQSLKIGILVNDSLGKRTKLRIFSNVKNLTDCDYPNLTNFSVTYVGYRELHSQNRHSTSLLPFIGRHAHTLCCIDFSLMYASHVVYPPAHPRHILFCVPANIKCNYKAPQSALDGHLITTQLRKPGTMQEHCIDWINMLKDVRKLEVALMTRFISWTIRHLDFFEPTIREYAKFLRRIDIMNVTMYDSGTHNTVSQLDARIFQNCSQLTELRLYRAPIIFHEDEIEPPTELIHLEQLPKTLEQLVIDGLPVSSLEILATISEFSHLKTFHYFQSQVPRRNMLWSNGINWDILQCMIKHPTLVNVKVHVTTIGQIPSHTLYEASLKLLAKKYGWSTTGIVPGYMNMFQITLTKPNEK